MIATLLSIWVQGWLLCQTQPPSAIMIDLGPAGTPVVKPVAAPVKEEITKPDTASQEKKNNPVLEKKADIIKKTVPAPKPEPVKKEVAPKKKPEPGPNELESIPLPPENPGENEALTPEQPLKETVSTPVPAVQAAPEPAAKPNPPRQRKERPVAAFWVMMP